MRRRRVRCEVVRGGELGGRKSVHVQGARLSLEPLGEADRDDLRFAVEQDADWLAASFVRSAEDVKRIREVLRGYGAEIPIIAKIEDPEGVANLDEVIDAADGTMVARGDLGVALPVDEVPLVQKRIIRTTVSRGQARRSPPRRCSTRWSATSGRRAPRRPTSRTRSSTAPPR